MYNSRFNIMPLFILVALGVYFFVFSIRTVNDSYIDYKKHISCESIIVGSKNGKDIFQNKCTFNKFVLYEVASEDFKDVRLDYNGANVWSGSSFSSDNIYVERLEGFPVQGDITYLYSNYSGGAHCCTSVISIVVSKERVVFSDIEYGNFVPPGNTPVLRHQNAGLLIAQEARFAYYDMPHYGMGFAESPSPSRLLVFEDGGWRADKPGEFPDIYEKWLTEFKPINENGCLSPSDMVTLSYYHYMLGKSQEQVLEFVQERIVPWLWMDARFLATDVHSMVTDFSPVGNVVLKSSSH